MLKPRLLEQRRAVPGARTASAGRNKLIPEVPKWQVALSAHVEMLKARDSRLGWAERLIAVLVCAAVPLVAIDLATETFVKRWLVSHQLDRIATQVSSGARTDAQIVSFDVELEQCMDRAASRLLREEFPLWIEQWWFGNAAQYGQYVALRSQARCNAALPQSPQAR